MSVVTYEVRDRVAYITMNRPEKLNAISGSICQSADAKEGLAAFREKGQPVWQGQ